MFFNFRFTSTMTGLQSGTNRPEIVDLYMFGYLRPLMTDRLVLSINADPNAVNGMGVKSGLSAEALHRLFRKWANSSTVITLQLPDYDPTKTTRFLVTNVQQVEGEVDMGEGNTPEPYSHLIVTFVRAVFGPDFAS